MQWILAVRTTALVAALAVPVLAHGGMYRSPGDVLPSGSQSGGSSGSGGSGSVSGPSGPATPAGSGGSSGSTAGPAVGSSATATMGRVPTGVPVGEDLTRWSYFWEFRKDSYLRLREAVHETGAVRLSDDYFMGAGLRAGVDTLRPTHAQALGEIVPALHRAMESTQQRDITSSCLVALAKIALEDADHPLIPALREPLKSHDQEIRETAALAMGISQRTDAVRDLIALTLDDQRGRALCERAEVDDRTRAFAAYGLGLVGYASHSSRVKRVILAALRSVLEDDSIRGMAVHIAALNAVGLLRPDTADRNVEDIRSEALAILGAYYDRELGVGRQLVQAHVAASAAALLEGGADPAARNAWARRLTRELRPKSEVRRNNSLAQSAALALGRMAGKHEDGAADAWISEALMVAFEDAQDLQTRYFALSALGDIGGTLNVAFLLDVLDRGTKALEKPWAALALGMHEHRRITEAGPGGRADDDVAKAIRAQFDEVKNPASQAAFAVALGLCRAKSTAPFLRDLLMQRRHQDDLAGYLCIGLALMDDRGSVDAIRDIVMTSARRPQLLLQAAIALGRLGDKTTALLLIDQMGASRQNLAVFSSLAFAVGQIGDRRTVAPLIQMSEDESRTDLARAFAVVALGGVADKESEPWNAKIGRLVNYRAAVETLFNQVSGILDIL